MVKYLFQRVEQLEKDNKILHNELKALTEIIKKVREDLKDHKKVGDICPHTRRK